MDQPDNLVLRMLSEIRAKQDEHVRILEEHTASFKRVEKKLGDMSRVFTSATQL